MTVKELIEELQKIPQEEKVQLYQVARIDIQNDQIEQVSNLYLQRTDAVKKVQRGHHLELLELCVK